MSSESALMHKKREFWISSIDKVNIQPKIPAPLAFSHKQGNTAETVCSHFFFYQY